MEIRRGKITDLDSIYRIERESFDSLSYSRDFLRELLIMYEDFFFVAIMDDQVVGYIVARTSGDIGHIISIAVDKKFRGMGIGNKLLDRVLEELKKAHAKRIFLEVSKDNIAAINLYEKKGFKIRRLLRNYYGFGRHAYEMIMNLDEERK